MTSELFPLASVSVKSPRLRWMEKHDVILREIGTGCVKWACWVLGSDKRYIDDTVDNALIKLARNNNWKTWLEEGWENE